MLKFYVLRQQHWEELILPVIHTSLNKILTKCCYVSWVLFVHRQVNQTTLQSKHTKRDGQTQNPQVGGTVTKRCSKSASIGFTATGTSSNLTGTFPKPHDL